MDIFADLTARGLIHQTTDEGQLTEWLASGSRTLYAGFDPTADSLHVGHLMALMILRRFQKAGHRPIALVGGATGMIGDPSGKSKERNLLDLDALRANVAAIQTQMRRFLTFDDQPGNTFEKPALLVNNYDWMSRFSYLEFLRDIGKNFSVNTMLTKDSVRARLENSDSGLSYTEFSYMLLQAYDFVHLYDAHGCELQVGGSDQWGNITAGTDLARRMRGARLYGMTCTLLLKSDGTKMGKTEGGAVWLDANRTSPYQFYQYWVNVDDADAGKCLRFLTELPLDEIDALDASRAADPGKRESQKRLAEELTKLVHGEEQAKNAQEISQNLFQGTATLEQLEQAAENIPSFTYSKEFFGEGISLAQALLDTTLAKSKSDARRTIEQGGIQVNFTPIKDVNHLLALKDLMNGNTILLKSGKRKYGFVRVQDLQND